MQDIKLQVGQRIRELRTSLGFSQERFALKIELDRTYLASVEAGHRNISLLNLQKIVHGLNVSFSEFFDGIR